MKLRQPAVVLYSENFSRVSYLWGSWTIHSLCSQIPVLDHLSSLMHTHTCLKMRGYNINCMYVTMYCVCCYARHFVVKPANTLVNEHCHCFSRLVSQSCCFRPLTEVVNHSDYVLHATRSCGQRPNQIYANLWYICKMCDGRSGRCGAFITARYRRSVSDDNLIGNVAAAYTCVHTSDVTGMGWSSVAGFWKTSFTHWQTSQLLI